MISFSTLNLFLLRHGQASDTANTDFNRPLTYKGQKQAKQKGILLQKLPPISFVLCSSACRTKETLYHLDLNLPSSAIIFEKDLYLASPVTMLHILQQIGHYETVLLIGHNPGLHQLSYDLISALPSCQLNQAEQNLAKSFPTCALSYHQFTCNHWFDINYHQGKLIAYYP